MKKIIDIIFVLVCLYLGYCLPDSLPNEGMFLNSRNPSRGFDKVKHVRKKIPDNLAKENSSLNLFQIQVNDNGTMSFSVDASKGREVEGIVEEVDGSINLKCPICNNIQTCNPKLHVLVPQTCKSSSSCCFTKWKYDKIIEKGCNDDTMIEFDEIDNKCKEGYPGVGEEYKMCRGVCKRDKPSTGEISSAIHVSVTSVGIFFAMFLTLFLK